VNDDEQTDPYAILGISPDADSDEIRRAWRVVARREHPDVGGDGAMFRRARQAFETVWAARDDQNSGQSSNRSGSRDGVADSGDDFVLDGETGPDAVVAVLVDQHTAVFGGTATVDRWRLVPCRACAGRGDRCDVCDTDGRIGAWQRIEVPIAPRTVDGDQIDMFGAGDAGKRRRDDLGRLCSAAGRAGNVQVHVQVRGDGQVGEVGDDLIMRAEVDLYDAVLGCVVDIVALDGPVAVPVPGGIQPGQRVRVRGRGRPRTDGGRGDLLVEVSVTVHEPVDEHERATLDDLRQRHRRATRPGGR
jgi:DnaJ-class molecular chaperone